MKQNTTLGERLQFLMDATGISQIKISAAIGVNFSTLKNYFTGLAFPRIDTLIKMADLFAVPLDYLVGRCDLEAAQNIQKDYAAHYMALRREPYEMYLVGRGRLPMNYQNCEAPWPYNLLDDIGNPAFTREVKWEDRWQDVLSPDQEAGLMDALESLTEREQKCITAYYLNGLSLDETGKLYGGVTRERVRQIIQKGVRKLRHPSRFNQIRFGLEGAKQKSEYTQTALELKKKRQTLDRLEEELDGREKALTDSAKALGAPAVRIGTNAMLEEMELSVRSFTVLHRAGCKTVGDVEAMAKAGKLICLRNMGLRSVEEVLDKLETMVGVRYRVGGINHG